MIASAGAAVMVIAATALPAFALVPGLHVGAQTSVSASVNGSGVGVNAALATRIKNITTHANQEIVRRIDALNALSTRVGAMARLSLAEQSNISAAIQSQITALNALQAKITVDATANSMTSLKTDVQSIISSYRIFALIIPQGTIIATAGRVATIVGIMNDLSTKFSARISAGQSAGENVTAATAALADFNTKVSDATTQAQAAASEVAALTPDNGTATVMASNIATLKDARSKLVAAQHDLIAARADADVIVKALVKFKVSATASTSASTSV